MKTNIIIVPTDFTSVAANALNHAIETAKALKGSIVLLHVCAKETEVAAAKKKVEALAQQSASATQIATTGVVKVGNIFDDIGAVAKELSAKLIIMGTHGVKGIQKLTGSYAMKVITNSEVPFIVVQERKIIQGYKNIVFPLDLNKETKQKVGFATDIAKKFGSKIHIIYPHETDEFFVQQLRGNLTFAKKFFNEHNVEFETVAGKTSGSSFIKEVVQFATSINADLISIMNINGAGLTNLFGGNVEQQIITNEAQIPVMCVNPSQVSIGLGVYM